MATTVFEGVVRGRLVELDRESGLPLGEKVKVTLSANGQSQPQSDGGIPSKLTDAEKLATLKRLAGAWAEDAKELDEYLEWNRQQRIVNRVEIDE